MMYSCQSLLFQGKAVKFHATCCFFKDFFWSQVARDSRTEQGHSAITVNCVYVSAAGGTYLDSRVTSHKSFQKVVAQEQKCLA